MNWLRRALLELWAMFLIAAVVGFLGPFGTYLHSRLADRVGDWWMLLMGAYVFVRPWIFALRWIAEVTSLPPRVLAPWGVVVTSAPLAMLWRSVGQDAFRELNGYSALLPFSLLCALAVLGTERWAAGVNERIEAQRRQQSLAMHSTDDSRQPSEIAPVDVAGGSPPLYSRLAASFQGPIIALQSEDHYVRVHGISGSELLLIRLRDAIAEMEGVAGIQVHRSWWVAHQGVAAVDQTGRNWSIQLQNGIAVPVARDSIQRLRNSGMLSVNAAAEGAA